MLEKTTVIIDIAFTENTRADVDYTKVGVAAETGQRNKHSQYRGWDINNSRHSLVAFNVETFGILGKEAREWLDEQFNEEANRYQQLKTYNRISVALHRARARQFRNIHGESTLNNLPESPLTNTPPSQGRPPTVRH